MKTTLIPLVVILVLIIGTFQANATRLAMENRRLLGDMKLEATVDNGPNCKTTSAASGTNTYSGAESKDDNPSYKNVGQGKGPSTDFHHNYEPGTHPTYPCSKTFSGSKCP